VSREAPLLADTSAWSNRHKEAKARSTFDAAVQAGKIATCGVVECELLFAARDAADLSATRTELRALPRLRTTDAVWHRAAAVMGLLAAAGPLHHRRAHLPDLLIAATAEVHGAVVLHYDGDFDVIASVTGQSVRAIAPLGTL
jgi:predicted nucleic acid-binding protein